MNWLKLTARERDAVVAIQIMGWTLDQSYCKTGHWRTDSMGLIQATYDDFGSGEFSPSTDIAAAWQVVERMREKGYRLRLDDHGSEWRAVFYSWGIAPNAALYALTAPEAICLAALRAMGVE